MPPPKDQSATDLLLELNHTINSIGVPATIALLRNSREQVSPDQKISFVVIAVCNQLTITVPDLQNKTDDRIQYAKGFIIFYLRKHFRIKWKDIKLVLNHRNQSWLWQLKKSIDQLKPNLGAHADWCKAKDIL